MLREPLVRRHRHRRPPEPKALADPDWVSGLLVFANFVIARCGPCDELPGRNPQYSNPSFGLTRTLPGAAESGVSLCGPPGFEVPVCSQLFASNDKPNSAFSYGCVGGAFSFSARGRHQLYM